MDPQTNGTVSLADNAPPSTTSTATSQQTNTQNQQTQPRSFRQLPSAHDDFLEASNVSGTTTTADGASAINHEVHWEGYVRKKGDWLPRWEERYLVLDGATLTYYNSKEEARSGRNLRGRMIISKVRPENYGKAHGFLIETKGHKLFHLCCSTELEKDMWVEMMQAAIDEGVKHKLDRTLMNAAASAAVQPSPSATQVDLRSFYFAFRELLISHSSSPQFFPKLSRDVVLTSNYAPTVPFWGEYHGLDGVLHFFSILYETVEFTSFFVTDIAQAKEGNTAVVAGRETMKNRDNGRKFTQQWQHTIEFAPDGRVKSLTMHADPVAASAVFGCNATSSLSLPMAAVIGNSSQDNPEGTLHVVVFRGEQISSHGGLPPTEEEFSDDSSSSTNESTPLPRRRVFLGLRLLTDGKTNVYAPTSSTSCLAKTRLCEPDEVPDPKWNSTHELPFKGSSRGKPCFMLIEAWEVREDEMGREVEEVVGVAKVNLVPFLALASTSRTVRESVVHSDIARGAVPQWYTLLSANETKFSCGRVQLSISFDALSVLGSSSSSGLMSNGLATVEGSPALSAGAPTPQVRASTSNPLVQSSSRSAIARGFSFRDTRRDNHHFRVGNTAFDVPRRYQMIKAVGQGAYGCVIAASDTETGQALAIKNVPNAFNDLIDAKRILREIRLMRHLNHPNLVNLVDLLRPPSLHDFNDVYIVTDLMETDLHRVIHSNQSISDDHIQYFLYQMLLSIHYVHSAEVLHRDLKPSNILVNSDCDLKLCDFGLARGVQGLDSGLTEYVVTRWYRAPELLLSSKYDKQVDVWAIGCILAEMLGRRPLFPGHDYLHQLKIIMDVIGSPSEDALDFITNPKAKRFILRQPKKPKVPLASVYPRASPLCLDLLDKMLVFDPRKRMTIAEALEHPYLSAVRDVAQEKTCDAPFDFTFENHELTKTKLQELIFEDVCAFHPEAAVPDSPDISPVPTSAPSGTRSAGIYLTEPPISAPARSSSSVSNTTTTAAAAAPPAPAAVAPPPAERAPPMPPIVAPRPVVTPLPERSETAIDVRPSIADATTPVSSFGQHTRQESHAMGSSSTTSTNATTTASAGADATNGRSVDLSASTHKLSQPKSQTPSAAV